MPLLPPVIGFQRHQHVGLFAFDDGQQLVTIVIAGQDIGGEQADLTLPVVLSGTRGLAGKEAGIGHDPVCLIDKPGHGDHGQ